jgi:hypothetical protein
MALITSSAQNVRDAAGLPAALAAARVAFEDMPTEVEAWVGPPTLMFAAFLMAGVAARRRHVTHSARRVVGVLGRYARDIAP